MENIIVHYILYVLKGKEIYMHNLILNIPENLVTPLISAVAIILGAILGGVFSWIVANKSTRKNIEEQKRIFEKNRLYNERNRNKRIYECANIIRLDICTVLFQSIRTIKYYNEKKEVTILPLPMNCDYSNVVAYLKWDFDLKELSYIYQLYGIVEKINYDLKRYINLSQVDFNLIYNDYELILEKVYDDNFKKIIQLDIEAVSYKELYNNQYIKKGYKTVLIKLDEICDKEF